MSIKKLIPIFALCDKNDNSKNQDGKIYFSKNGENFCHICHMAILKRIMY